MTLKTIQAALLAVFLTACTQPSVSSPADPGAKAVANAAKSVALGSEDVVQGIAAVSAMKAIHRCAQGSNSAHCHEAFVPIWSALRVTKGEEAPLTEAACDVAKSAKVLHLKSLQVKVEVDASKRAYPLEGAEAEEENALLDELEAQVQQTLGWCLT